MIEQQYDLEEQQEKEQLQEEDDAKLSKEVYKCIKHQKKYENYLKEQELLLNKSKHKAHFTRQNNQNCYVCDSCGEIFPADKGTLIHKPDEPNEPDKPNKLNEYGEYAYCDKCLKQLYPSYRRIQLYGSVKKTDFRDNHCDLTYNKGFRY